MIVDIHTHTFGNITKGLENQITSKREVIALRKNHPETFKAMRTETGDIADLLVEDMAGHGINKALIQPGINESPERVLKAADRPKIRSDAFSLTSTGI